MHGRLRLQPINDERILFDAQQALSFLRQQAEEIETEVYEVPYPDAQYPELVPVQTTGDEWVQVITYYSLDRVGRAEWFHHYGKDVPYADFERESASVTVAMAAIGYEYTLEELAQARKLAISITGERASSALIAYEQFMDRVALWGDAQKGYAGLLNNALVTSGLAPNDGAGGLRTFVSKTPTQILRDINTLLGGIYLDTNRVEIADTLLLGLDRFNYLATTPRSDASDETILEYLMRANVLTMTTGRQLRIRVVMGLETAGTGATQRMVAYRYDRQVAKLHLPMPHRFLPAMQDGPLIFKVPGIFRTGGTEVRRKKAVRYLDGI